jgi:hypothetical protein
MDDRTRQALADGILAGLACYGTDGQAWRGAEPRDLARHLALWGGGASASGTAPASPPLSALAEQLRKRSVTREPGDRFAAGLETGFRAAGDELSRWLETR